MLRRPVNEHPVAPRSGHSRPPVASFVEGSAVDLLPSERKMHYLFNDQLAADKNTLFAHWRSAEQLCASML